MAPFSKFNAFIGDLGTKVHNLNADTLKIYLTNTAPVATNTVYNTPADLSTAGGYTAGGQSVGAAYSQTGGVGSLTGSNITWTATTGFGPFRYEVLYNSTPGSQPLIGWWDIGSNITLGAGEVWVIQFGASLFTLA